MTKRQHRSIHKHFSKAGDNTTIRQCTTPTRCRILSRKAVAHHVSREQHRRTSTRPPRSQKNGRHRSAESGPPGRHQPSDHESRGADALTTKSLSVTAQTCAGARVGVGSPPARATCRFPVFPRPPPTRPRLRLSRPYPHCCCSLTPPPIPPLPRTARS